MTDLPSTLDNIGELAEDPGFLAGIPWGPLGSLVGMLLIPFAPEQMLHFLAVVSGPGALGVAIQFFGLAKQFTDK